MVEVDVFHIVQLSPCHVRSLKARTANAVLWGKLKVASSSSIKIRIRIRTSPSSSSPSQSSSHTSSSPYLFRQSHIFTKWYASKTLKKTPMACLQALGISESRPADTNFPSPSTTSPSSSPPSPPAVASPATSAPVPSPPSPQAARLAPLYVFSSSALLSLHYSRSITLFAN